MTLKEYIAEVLEQAEPGEMKLELNLTQDCRVSDVVTGNKVTFIIYKG